MTTFPHLCLSGFKNNKKGPGGKAVEASGNSYAIVFSSSWKIESENDAIEKK